MDSSVAKQFNILIVDDNPKNIQVIGNILRCADYLIGFATSGAQALDLLKKTYDYDLVLLDINMPSMNGFETCAAIREDEKLKEIPVIFLTAYTDAENVITGFESGAQDYITKPFNAKELLARVDTHLQLKHKSDLVKQLNQELETKVAERTEELEKAYNDLNNLDNMKTDYLLFISQEIRAPLNGMMGAINLIKNHEYSSTIRNLLETLSSSVTRLEEFTQKALFFNQLVKGIYPIQIGKIDMKDMIHFTILELAGTIQEKHIEIIKDGMQAEAIVNADNELLYKAISYAVDNAVKFAPTNSKIWVELKEEDQSVSFTCIDSGDGFSDEILDKFLMPYQLMNNIEYQRSILTLTTIKQIMVLHGGELIISNMENRGACVKLVFPKP